MNEDLKILKSVDERIDELEVVILENEMEGEYVHTFTPGLYSREMALLAGQVIVSKVHKTEHQYCLLSGSAFVMINDEWSFIKAPFVGITKPHTRRVAIITESGSWITFHATDKKTVEEIENDIIEKRVNAVLGKELRSKISSQLNEMKCLGV